ncbi:MAG: hypothetical protein QG670_2876, partial [Thermoproteota archaeon]|nr:hypothetical protein [Thermoproteota archaeon]
MSDNALGMYSISMAIIFNALIIYVGLFCLCDALKQL